MAEPQKKIPKTIRIQVKGSQTLPIEKLEAFQGSLKHLEKVDYEALRKTIIDFGFSFVVHVWKQKDHFYIIDGHQRVFTLLQMKKIDGWKIPEIPVAVVEAETYQEAKRKVLAAASQYGKVSRDSLKAYLDENKIAFEDVIANFRFPEVEYGKMADEFSSRLQDSISEGQKDISKIINDSGTAESSFQEKSSASGSTQVKQLQLYFSMDDYVEFVQKVEAVQKEFGTESISDTLLRLLRERNPSKA